MRIVILWQGITGYLAACWRALAREEGVELSVLATPTFRNFDQSLLAGLDAEVLSPEREHDLGYIAEWIGQRKPDVIAIAGWAHRASRELAFLPQFENTPFLMGMDTPWKGTVRQRLGRYKIGKFLQRMDRAVVAGERAWQFARQLGFEERRICRGVYGYDDAPLADLYQKRLDAGAWPRKFLYVGRYVEAKAVDVLLRAYDIYRDRVTDPWELACAGAGEMEAAINAAKGVQNLGFVQPNDQPGMWLGHGAFVLPSRYEPWGVVVAEACAAGLPVLCTEAVCSSVELVRPYANGVIVPPDDADRLAAGMVWMHRNAGELPKMGGVARGMAVPFSAPFWAKRWRAWCEDVVAERKRR